MSSPPHRFRRRSRALRRKAAELGLTNFQVEKLDLHDRYDVAQAQTWDIDVLWNNAGLGESGPVSEIPIDLVRHNYETNVFLPLVLTQGFIKNWVANKTKAKIVFTSSMGGLFTPAGWGVYVSTKHALESIAEAMQQELEPFGIKVQTINPGAYLTGYNETMADTAFRWLDDSRNFTKRADAAQDLRRSPRHARRQPRPQGNDRPHDRYRACGHGQVPQCCAAVRRGHAEEASDAGLGQPDLARHPCRAPPPIGARLPQDRAGVNPMRRHIHALIVFSFATLFGDGAMAQSTNDIETSNKAAVQAKFEAWSAGTGSPFELLADDATWTITGRSIASKTYPNKEAFMNEVIRPFNARMSVGLKPTIRSIHADGETVVIFFDANGTARDGKPYVNTYAWFFDMRGGKVVKASAFFDSIEFNELWQRVMPAASK